MRNQCEFVRIGCYFGTILLLLGGTAHAADQGLPGAAPLIIQQPLDEVMVEGINRFCLRELAASREGRAARWKRDCSNAQAYAASIAANRERFRTFIGASDLRLTADQPGRYRFELLASLDRSSVVARTSRVTVHAVRWQVLDGVTAEGLLLVPETVRAGVVALPDADWTPEMFCGLSAGVPNQVQFARRLAAAGCPVAIPALISRSDELSTGRRLKWAGT